MAENSQIPRRGYIPLRLNKSTDKAEFGRWLTLDSGPGPNQWSSHWLSVMTASIQSLKKVGYNPLHYFVEEKSRHLFSFNTLILRYHTWTRYVWLNKQSPS